jgi:ectoine hydroxylase-related dioxygenase (phytanoyl-CoA dioxygenase family)
MMKSYKEQYAQDGYLSPLQIIDGHQAALSRKALEEAESVFGPLHYRFKIHTLMEPAFQLATHSRILDVVEQLIGPDILLYSAAYIIKEPNTKAHVSWHQDMTYWGLSSDTQVSAWLALSPATERSGCMKMIPGSHLKGCIKHRLIQDENNVLLNNQAVTGLDEKYARFILLAPGEASFHHGWTLHASTPNQSEDRRIGLNIQYIATDNRQTLIDDDTALLVRGVDDYHHFNPNIIASRDGQAEALAQQEIMQQRFSTINKKALACQKT